MKTVDCSTFGVLIENHEPVELIDVRPKTEFAAVHIPGARSMPLSELSRPHLHRTNLPAADRVYVISDDRGSASLAAGVLKASGDVDVVVVDGGMKAWVGCGLPVKHPVFDPHKVPTYLRRIAVILALICIGLAPTRPIIGAIVLLAAGALLLRAHYSQKALSVTGGPTGDPRSSA